MSKFKTQAQDYIWYLIQSYNIINNYDKIECCVSKAFSRRSNLSKISRVRIAMQTRSRHIISHVNSTDTIEEVKRRNKQRRLEVGNLAREEVARGGLRKIRLQKIAAKSAPSSDSFLHYLHLPSTIFRWNEPRVRS